MRFLLRCKSLGEYRTYECSLFTLILPFQSLCPVDAVLYDEPAVVDVLATNLVAFLACTD